MGQNDNVAPDADVPVFPPVEVAFYRPNPKFKVCVFLVKANKKTGVVTPKKDQILGGEGVCTFNDLLRGNPVKLVGTSTKHCGEDQYRHFDFGRLKCDSYQRTQ